ncbi:unnamed protein product [Didymodactylos carnosus]|uniref:Ubiquitin carboxyl-terminal hydrolase n=1 Tax=Didymodactylos carnosus TaxID=1234261 RepID=A0A815GSC5_9BILA|nr:unnamed protein product [Didymodactylos carnosus]CAF1344057.1 unnamed protein product [Didymodactylos carnosus]CAF4011091.1 unnamed protein product [Didymodactylos carnosus]CAF4207967.1 unnamed protein product [Didymodactylos carnosus]
MYSIHPHSISYERPLYSSLYDVKLLTFKVVRNKESKTDYEYIKITNNETLEYLKQRVIERLHLYPLNSNNIRLMVFNAYTNSWINVRNIDKNEKISDLHLSDSDYISYTVLDVKSDQLSTNNFRLSDWTISSMEKKLTFKLFRKTVINLDYTLLINISTMSTIKQLKQKSHEKLYLYSTDFDLTLFVYDDDNKQWIKFDSALDDCTLELLDFKDYACISIQSENDRTSLDSKICNNQSYTPGLCGLINMGNTCYMNSALQCLSNIPQLTDYYLNFTLNNDEQSVSNVYYKLIKQMWSGEYSFITPKQLKEVVSQHASIFTDYRQKDAQEFMNVLLNVLYQEQSVSIIDQLFYGQILSTVTCLMCESKETKQELITFLPLCINNKQTFEINYYQFNGQYKQIFIDISIQYSTTISHLIDQFIRDYDSSLDKVQLLPVKLNDNNIINNYYSFDSLTNITDNRISLLQLPLIIDKLNQKYIPCLFINTNTNKPFRPLIKLLGEYTSYAMGFKEQINRLLNHLVDIIGNSKDEFKLHWLDWRDRKHDLKFNENENDILLRLDKITIEIDDSSAKKYALKQGENIRSSLLPSLSSSSSSSTCLTLDKLLQRFFKEDLLSGDCYCSHCTKATLCKQKIELCLPLPPVVIIQLKRFTYDEYSSGKVDTFIQYPIQNLNLNHYLTQEINNDGVFYDLIAVLNHTGDLSFGHYVTYAKNNRTQRWYSFNDDYVQEIEENRVITKNAYILVYVKQKSKS